MRLKFLIVTSLIILIIAILNIMSLLRQDFVFNQDEKYESSISIWTTTPGLSIIFEKYEEQSNIKITVKQFRDSDSLLEELELSEVNKGLPDIVEVNTDYGISEVVNMLKVYPLSSKQQEDGDFHESIYQSFQKDDLLYAYPLGIEIPLLYISTPILKRDVPMHIYPFKTESYYKEYQVIQDRINERNNKKEFWLFHMDQSVAWYWNAYKTLETNHSIALDFEEVWNNLVTNYELIPPFENHMAITRFSNLELGSLITSSRHLLTVQQLVGNNFEFEVYPFIINEADKILIKGNGLAILSDNKAIINLLDYLKEPEIQLELLSRTGWLPSRRDLIKEKAFIHQLPMSKYLNDLAMFEKSFTGIEFKNNNKKKWMEIKEQIKKIE